MRILGGLALVAASLVLALLVQGQESKDAKDEKAKKADPKIFVRVYDDGKAKKAGGVVIEVQGLKVEFLESSTLKLKLKPSVEQKTPSGGVIYSFNGAKLVLKETAPVIETVTFVRGPKPGTITATVPKGKLLVSE